MIIISKDVKFTQELNLNNDQSVQLKGDVNRSGVNR
jgi:hypothetical protein